MRARMPDPNSSLTGLLQIRSRRRLNAQSVLVEQSVQAIALGAWPESAGIRVARQTWPWPERAAILHQSGTAPSTRVSAIPTRREHLRACPQVARTAP